MCMKVDIPTRSNSNVLPYVSPTWGILGAGGGAGGLSSKSYSGNNRQSDEQASRVVNMVHFKQQWDEIGHVLFAFVEALALSPWNAPAMYESVEDSYFNSLTAYYLLLCNVMLLQQKYGPKWIHHFVADLTLTNTFHDIGCYVSRCLFHPSDIPFMPDKTIEWCEEPHFGECKKPFRGMPRFKDMLLGTMYTRY